MKNIPEALEGLLPLVRKPARYVGGEWNEIYKDKQSVRLRMAFCFPDTYEIGMSHLGLRILYGLYNTRPDVWCERAFAPWLDMEAEMRRSGTSLYALESGDTLSAFDVLAFTLQYELSFTNVLTMLDLGDVPLKSAERGEGDPIVMAGGPCAFNPEPMADFIDLFVIGEGEEVSLELLDLFVEAKTSGAGREEVLRRCAQISGVYVPSLYAPRYDENGILRAVEPLNGAPPVVEKRIVRDLDAAYFPVTPVVPNTEVVHDRVMLELFRGCARGCRFCQAGHTTRPVRARAPETLLKQAQLSLAHTGYEEVALTSLSTSDYGPLEALCDGLLTFCEPRRVSLSLPSLRADSFSRELMEKVQKVRRSGLTFAPEAGTARLRDVINKNLTEEDLLRACSLAFDGGWNSVKLYFMCGLPTETPEDLDGIAELAHKVYAQGRKGGKGRAAGVTVSVSCFVPKPHTPFQWERQSTLPELLQKQTRIKQALRRQVSFRWHEAETSVLEGALSRGDRRVGAAILAAYRDGARMDGWRECFSLSRWEEAFRQHTPGMAHYAHREIPETETLPWAHISSGVSLTHFRRERAQAYRETASPDCRNACMNCGISEGGVTCHGEA